MKFRELPGRLIVGAYVLHTGIEKWSGEESTAKAVHGMAANAYPIFKSVEPKKFLRMLAAGEMAVGASLLLPSVPTVLAGAALSGFSGALLGMYARTPAMRRSGSVWPSSQGIAVSKDSWMLAIGFGLVADALTRSHRHDEEKC
ncbi:MAG TPA: hypothetical protein VMU99_05885 [Acidimicrobiales bacterium]|nr:hypothetical protein [Acidimicrobiales bacterium]